MSEGRITRDDLNPNVLESLRGPQGEPGQQGAPGIPGEQGLPGNDAEVTSENIERALGFLPTELQIATESTLGGIKPDGETIFVDPETGIASGANIYTLPIASTGVLGGVKVDGNTIKIDGTGTISSSATTSSGEWIQATLLSGWTTDLSRPKYYKDASGYVHFTGAVKGLNGVVFNFPVGYRPNSQIDFPAMAVMGDAMSGFTFKGISQCRVSAQGGLDFGLMLGAGVTYVINGSFKAI